MPGVAQRLQSERLKYPGLNPSEIPVMQAWLKINEARFARFDYNVRIGPKQDPGPQFSEATRRSTILNGQLRLDGVFWTGVDNSYLPPQIEHPSEVYAVFPAALALIIETERRATNRTVGDMLIYRDMWATENPNSVKPDLVIACVTYTPNIVPAVMNNGIQINTVRADFSILRGPQ